MQAENSFQQFTFGDSQNYVVGPNIASAATIAPTYGCHHITGSATISTITIPWPGFAGQITLIPDGAWTLTTGGNIKAGYQAVVNQPVTLEYDGTSWYIVGGGGGGGAAVAFQGQPNVSYAATVIGIGTIQVEPVLFPQGEAVASAGVFVSNSYSATNAGSSRADTVSFSIGLYTRNVSTLSLASSSSASTAFTVTGSSSSASYQGLKQVLIPFAAAVTPGNYWFALVSSNATAGNAIAGALSNVVASYAGGQSGYAGIFGSNTAASEQVILGMGSYSVTSGALPASIGFSELLGSALGNTAQPVVNFIAFTA